MIEDAGARADGGDTEAPAEAPPANEKLKHTRSSRRRLERVLTESSLKAEDRVDEYLEWFEAEPPAEIQQLKSCWCRNLFRFILYGATIAALGISVGNAALVYILTSVICVHALVRALGKCGAVRFRNGRFISPVVLDEYLERKSVDAVLRQEREKETDPFL